MPQTSSSGALTRRPRPWVVGRRLFRFGGWNIYSLVIGLRMQMQIGQMPWEDCEKYA